LLVRLVEGEAKAEHARPLPPVPDDLLAVWRQQVEIPENAEFLRIGLDGLDRLNIGPFAKRAGRMDHGGVDPGLRHLLQRIVHISIVNDSPLLRAVCPYSREAIRL